MPVLSQGNSQTFTFTDYDSLTVQAGSGVATFESPIGTVVAVFSGTRTFGPYSKSSGRLTATVQDCYFEYADGYGPIDRVQKSSGAEMQIFGAASSAAVDLAVKQNALNRYAYAVHIASGQSSEFGDISGNGRNLLVEPANTGAFAFSGNMSTLLGTAAGLVVPAANATWNPAREWLIVHLVFKANVGPSQNLWSWSYANTAGINGVQVEQTGSGYVQVNPRINNVDTGKTTVATATSLPMTNTTAITLSGTFSITSGSPNITYSATLPASFGIGSQVRGTGIPEGAVVLDFAGSAVTLSVNATATNGTATLTARTPNQYVAMTLVFDPTTGTFQVWKDGTISDYYLGNNYPGGPNAYPDAATSERIRIGASSGASSGTMAMQVLSHHIYKGTGAPPLTLGSIIKHLTDRPRMVVPEDLFLFASNSILLGIGPAQSNEAGPGGGLSGTFYVSRNSGNGAALVDGPKFGLTGGSGYNTAWPSLAAKLGARRKKLDVMNFGIGTTSLADTWVGRLRSYSAAMNVTPGSYVLDGGNVYKANGTLGTIYQLNVAPSAGVGASGLSSWTNMGAARAQDVAGYVYPPTDTYFDPNSLMSDERSKLLARPGYDLKAHLISIGQTDTTVVTTRQQYSLAIQYAASYFTSQGIHTFVAMTSTSNGSDAWFTSDLRPGRLDALSALAANPLVHDGGDVAALGILTTETAVNGTSAMEATPKLLNESPSAVHFNAAAQQLRANIHNSALLAAGF